MTREPPRLRVDRRAGSPDDKPFSSRLMRRLRAVASKAAGSWIRTADGVAYRQAGSRRNTRDERTYEVIIPGGERMRVRAAPSRVFHDLTPDPRVAVVDVARERVRPGKRVLLLGAGTGAAAARLAELVGPAGGVVAIDPDRESIRFARRRYAASHIAFEIAADTAPELDGSFDAVFLMEPSEPAPAKEIAGLIQACGAPGVAVVATAGGPARAAQIAQAITEAGERASAARAAGGWHAVMAIRPEPPRQPGRTQPPPEEPWSKT